MNPAPRRALVCVTGLKTPGCLVKDGRVTRERVEPVSARRSTVSGSQWVYALVKLEKLHLFSVKFSGFCSFIEAVRESKDCTET